MIMFTNANTNNNLQLKCKNCVFSTYKGILQKVKANSEVQDSFVNYFNEITEIHKGKSTPIIHQILHKRICELLEVGDLYTKEKRHSNMIAKAIYNDWKPKVLSAVYPFDIALRLALAGNIMDYGVNDKFDVHSTIEAVFAASIAIDYSSELKSAIKNAKHILYLGDNAGEIMLDKLFIETLLDAEVTYAVKSAPILNDVTMEDADVVRMQDVAEVITNGYDAPSTILSEASSEFLEVYHSADLIISKGMGNYEGLMNENDPRIFFLLMAKCDYIADKLNVPKGSFVVYNSNL